MRLVDLQLSFPAILVALMMLAVLGKGVDKVVIALVIVQWAYYARTVRGSALVERRREYIEAAACLALPARRIMFRHLLPNCLPPLIVIATMQVARAIALEATLSFLGVGVPITEPSLGLLIANGYEYMLSGSTGSASIPGIALLITIVGINLVGDQLRDVLNPRLTAMSDADPRGAQPAHAFLHPRRRREGGRWRLLRRRARRGAGAGRRIRLGQDRHRLLDPRPGRSARPHRRRRSILFERRGAGDSCPSADARILRGNRIAMIFQDPMMTLNPVLRIDTQMIEAVQAHAKVAQAEARARARDALGRSASPRPTNGCAPIRTSSPAACASASPSPSRCCTSPS